ncbi:MAG: hypothetical protein LCH38_10590 [Proteobacteria bacterium]|nr:hypothetical protein [Pseudomonadota bacterium]
MPVSVLDCRRLALAAPLLFGIATAAQAYKHEDTGLEVNLSGDFTVTEGPAKPGQSVIVHVNTKSGTPKARNVDGNLCAITVIEAAANNGLEQDTINKAIVSEAFQGPLKASIGRVFTLSELRSFNLKDVMGLEFEGDPKLGPDAENIRAFFSLMETSAGRTTLICVTDKAGYAAALPVFRTIRTGVTPPTE